MNTKKIKDEAKKNNSKVLVHCQAGVSRSPTIVIAYLMRQFGISMNDAYNKVLQMRPIIAPNIAYYSQLMDFDAKLKSSTSSSNLAQQLSSRFSNCSSSVNSTHANIMNTNTNILKDSTNSSSDNNSVEANKSAIECN